MKHRIMSTLTLGEIVEVLSHAKSLDAYDLQQKLLTKKERSLDQEITDETLQQMAQDEGISAHYVDKALALFYPTREQKITDLQKYAGKLTFTALRNEYVSQCIGVLQRLYPQEDFNIYHNDDYYISEINLLIRKVGKKKYRYRKWFSKFPMFNKKWVGFRIYTSSTIKISPEKCHLEVNLYDPRVLPACGETLQELHELFKDQIERIETLSYYIL